MYKKQMVFQRIVCMAVLTASALVFFYSLGLMTDMFDSLYLTIINPARPENTTVRGSGIYYTMQPFNSSLTRVSIGMILVSLVLFIMNTHSRRKYYIGNFVAIGLSTVCNIAVSVWAVVNISAFRAQFVNLDFAALKEHSEKWDTLYTESTFWFDAGYVVFGLVILATVLLIVNLILKLTMMKEEKRLIGSRKDVKV